MTKKSTNIKIKLSNARFDFNIFGTKTRTPKTFLEKLFHLWIWSKLNPNCVTSSIWKNSKVLRGFSIAMRLSKKFACLLTYSASLNWKPFNGCYWMPFKFLIISIHETYFVHLKFWEIQQVSSGTWVQTYPKAFTLCVK